MVMDVEKKITRSNRIFGTILRKIGGRKQKLMSILPIQYDT
jgi:hypothetical protein